MPLHLAPLFPPPQAPFLPALQTSYLLQPDQFLWSQHTLRKKAINGLLWWQCLSLMWEGAIVLQYIDGMQLHENLIRPGLLCKSQMGTWCFLCNLRVFTWDGCHFGEQDFVTKLHHHCEVLSIFKQGEVKKSLQCALPMPHSYQRSEYNSFLLPVKNHFSGTTYHLRHGATFLS